MKQLQGGAAVSDLIIVTPTDTKTFHIGTGQPASPGSAPTRAPNPTDLVGEDDEEVEIDEAGRIHPLAIEDEDADLDDTEEDEEEDPMALAMRLAEEGAEEHDAVVDPSRSRRRGNAQPGSACGRCGGSGQIKTPLDGGGFVDGTCPVCQGNGTITRFGGRPSAGVGRR